MAARLTVGLLNWKRPENLVALISCLRTQTEPIEIFVWNNNPQSPQGRGHRIEWLIDSSVNRVCMPRWWMLRFARTEYVTSFDDDLIPADSGFVAELLKAMDDRFYPNGVVGAFGIRLKQNVEYKDCPEVKPGSPCDVVLGRQLCLSTKTLRSLDLPYQDERWKACDDIVISGMLRGRSEHWTHSIRTAELDDSHALCHRAEHCAERQAARKEFFTI